MINYGVLKGPVVDSGREDAGNGPHFQIVILANGNRFRVPVNVKSKDGSEVLFSVKDPLADHPLLSQLSQISEGFTGEEDNPGFLDYLRDPMFEITAMRLLPASATVRTTISKISSRVE